MATMQRTGVLLALAVTVVALSSCGKAPATAIHTTSSVASTPSPSKAPSRITTHARALAFAQAVNLRASDVPGFKVSSEHQQTTSGERGLERSMLMCAGTPSGTRPLVESGSGDFQRGDGIAHLGVSSDVSVSRTSAGATRELGALRSERTRHCLERYLQALFGSHSYGGAHVGGVSIARGVPPSLGTSGSFAWRITASFTVQRVHVPFYVDVLGFVDGPAQVTLLSSGLPLAFPAEAQEHLFALLAQRAREHAL